MEQEKEAVYLINGDKYLHLRENGAGVGFATYRRFTGEPLESGQISPSRIFRPMAGTAFPLPGTGISSSFRTMSARPSNWKASRSSKTFRRQASAGGVSGSRKLSRPTFGSSTTAMTTFTASRTAA